MYRKYFKRPFDFIMALVGLIVLSPVLLVIAILVRIKLGSPVIFKQQRPGLNEKIFTIYKFRTMTNERDEKGTLLPIKDRLTRFGRFLRSTSLDELPELWNILKGDMSFVGPRPLSVNYLPYYTDRERRRHEVVPGLTGLAQINGRNTLPWEERFEFDVYYVENISFAMDLNIMFKTIIKVLKRSDVSDFEDGTTPGDFNKYRAKEFEGVRHD
ncbi:MAG: sugar transferase [Firmicutes bacterium]|nr:sugar transferase [Bacillota bacterium]